MNAKEFLDYCKDKTDDELQDIEVQGWWDVGNLEDMMQSQGIPLDEFTIEEKRKILHDVMDEWGDRTTEEINNAIDEAVEELHVAKMDAIDSADDYEAQMETLRGLDLDDTQFAYYKEALDALHNETGDTHGYMRPSDVLNDARKCTE